MAMTRDHQHNQDSNVNAARIVAGSTDSIGPQRAAPASASLIQAQVNQAAGQLAASNDMEAAWIEWSRHIQKVDERAMTLLKAAFEAGWDARKL